MLTVSAGFFVTGTIVPIMMTGAQHLEDDYKFDNTTTFISTPCLPNGSYEKSDIYSVMLSWDQSQWQTEIAFGFSSQLKLMIAEYPTYMLPEWTARLSKVSCQSDDVDLSIQFDIIVDFEFITHPTLPTKDHEISHYYFALNRWQCIDIASLIPGSQADTKIEFVYTPPISDDFSKNTNFSIWKRITGHWMGKNDDFANNPTLGGWPSLLFDNITLES